MTDLVTWLREQLDEDERDARECHTFGCAIRDEAMEDVNFDGQADLTNPDKCSCPVRRRLLDVAAKRAILDRYKNHHWHAPAIPGATSEVLRTEDTGACRTCVTERLLAQPYADRPGFNPEWAVI